MSTMKTLFLTMAALFGAAFSLILIRQPLHAADARTPVLVELFTSEGCSSCPPADRFLQKLDTQPVPGVEMIVLSEHVDYWNQIGWKDPFSAHSYSERQTAYSQRLGLDSVYTPQMVVDGTSEFVGSDPGRADKAFAQALRRPKISLQLSGVAADSSNILHAHLQTGILDPAFGAREAEAYIAVTLNHAESDVSAGENSGHKLSHVSVVRSLVKVGLLKRGQGLTQDVQQKLPQGTGAGSFRLVAFIQERGQGRVLGAASAPVGGR